MSTWLLSVLPSSRHHPADGSVHACPLAPYDLRQVASGQRADLMIEISTLQRRDRVFITIYGEDVSAPAEVC